VKTSCSADDEGEAAQFLVEIHPGKRAVPKSDQVDISSIVNDMHAVFNQKPAPISMQVYPLYYSLEPSHAQLLLLLVHQH
jgi:hypothetical protein